jgi:DNA-binding PadR family transcriptional regulator
VKRRPGTLLPLEVAILESALELSSRGTAECHGYLIASAMQGAGESRTLTAHGTLYKALDRMKKAGLLESRWEDPAVAAAAERPRRRLYRVTAAGEAALAEAMRLRAEEPAPLRPGMAT